MTMPINYRVLGSVPGFHVIEQFDMEEERRNSPSAVPVLLVFLLMFLIVLMTQTNWCPAFNRMAANLLIEMLIRPYGIYVLTMAVPMLASLCITMMVLWKLLRPKEVWFAVSIRDDLDLDLLLDIVRQYHITPLERAEQYFDSKSIPADSTVWYAQPLRKARSQEEADTALSELKKARFQRQFTLNT